MAKLAELIIQIRTYVADARQIDRQPELLPEAMRRVKQLALERLLINIGEATTRIPASEKNRFPDVPWRDIAAFRNVLVHNYEGLNIQIIRDIFDSDKLDGLLQAMEGMNPEVEQVRRARSPGT
ncbi:MAG: DUF86 domain-containing protein [Rhizobiales bacterium]|nr:DUF86 domain-containing protein [Hyphomicrobiales bacterium]